MLAERSSPTAPEFAEGWNFGPDLRVSWTVGT